MTKEPTFEMMNKSFSQYSSLNLPAQLSNEGMDYKSAVKEIYEITQVFDEHLHEQQVDFYLPQASLIIEIDGPIHCLFKRGTTMEYTPKTKLRNFLYARLFKKDKIIQINLYWGGS